MTTPPGFDELIHPPTRLSLMALLAATEWAEFGFLEESLQLTDSADLVTLTPQGRTASHVEALRQLVNRAGWGAGGGCGPAGHG